MSGNIRDGHHQNRWQERAGMAKEDPDCRNETKSVQESKTILQSVLWRIGLTEDGFSVSNQRKVHQPMVAIPAEHVPNSAQASEYHDHHENRAGKAIRVRRCKHKTCKPSLQNNQVIILFQFLYETLFFLALTQRQTNILEIGLLKFFRSIEQAFDFRLTAGLRNTNAERKLETLIDTVSVSDPCHFFFTVNVLGGI